jgi:DNA (cytosine-5)-methyltransferase 1
MRYLSVCSGIEAASAAWHDFGWTPVGFSEIEAFPSAVLAHRFPHVPNFGDMTKYKEWPLAAGSVDLLVGGTPCQSFSVAGLRKGLDDPRGNLMLTYLAIADHFQIPWLVWENVPGVLSSNGGRDFGAFVGALGQLGYRWAYRVLDAQYFGVPQRRRRVFVVASLGNRTNPAEVLFEPESLCGVRPEGQGKPAEAFERSDATNSGVLCREHQADWDECGCWCRDDIKCPWCDEWTSGLHQDPEEAGLSCCGAWVKRTCGTLSDGAHMGGGLNGQDATSGRIFVDGDGRVRRITPLEAERLMGFPDGWTDISYRERTSSDGRRFRALGNSMAVPVMRWIGQRIKDA